MKNRLKIQVLLRLVTVAVNHGFDLPKWYETTIGLFMDDDEAVKYLVRNHLERALIFDHDFARHAFGQDSVCDKCGIPEKDVLANWFCCWDYDFTTVVEWRYWLKELVTLDDIWPTMETIVEELEMENGIKNKKRLG